MRDSARPARTTDRIRVATRDAKADDQCAQDRLGRTSARTHFRSLLRNGVKGSVTSENSPKHGKARRAVHTGAHRPPGMFDRRFHPGPTGPVSARDYLIQASTLSLLASTHFLAAASSDSLSWAMYLATVFWSSFVQLKFFTRL